MHYLVCIGMAGLLAGLVVGCDRSATSANTESDTTSAQKTSTTINTNPTMNPTNTANVTNEVAVIKTAFGEMVIAFWPEVAPKTVESFKKLARQGFYDGTAFHRIIDGFMIQGGDPLSKTDDPAVGTGGPGFRLKAEFSDRPHVRGVISMARSPGDNDSAGSQFFICLGDASFLNGQYTDFGKLIKGDDVLAKLGSVPVTMSHGERSKPVNRVGVESIKIVAADSIK